MRARALTSDRVPATRTAILALALALLLPACGGSQVETPPQGPVQDESFLRERFQAYIETHNSHDIEAELALYADEVVFEIPQNSAIMPREDLRPRLRWDAVTESRLSATDIEVEGDTVTVNDLVETSTWLQLAGVERMLYEPGAKFVFTDGRISAVMPSAPLAESQDAVALTMNELMDWVIENRPEVLEGLPPGGQLPYDGEGARLLLELLRQWREEEGR